MTLEEIIHFFPKKYICVHNTKLSQTNIITEADVLCVYDSLRIAAENKNMIKRYIKQYPDFDIIYGDYNDYVSKRSLNPMVDYHFSIGAGLVDWTSFLSFVSVMGVIP